MLRLTYLDPRVTDEHLGLISYFFDDADPRPAIEQINERYAHGGGWTDLRVGDRGFTLAADGSLKYPGDPRMKPYAEAMLHDGGGPDAVFPERPDGSEIKPERIMIYESGFVAVVQDDNSFRVSRLD